MDKDGPIIVVEDDLDDQEFLSEILLELNQRNEVVFFSDARAAYNYLLGAEIKPFIIISNISLPGMSGLELREKIFHDPNLQAKGIPYLFMTAGNTQKMIQQAYGLSVQGIFHKPSSLVEWKVVLKKILDYWNASISLEGY